MDKVLFNNRIINKKNVCINFEDRGYQFGDGIYEVVGVYDGSFFKLQEHLIRLFQSAREIYLDLPFSKSEISINLEELRKENNLENGIVYLQVSRGVAPRTHYFPKKRVQPIVIGYVEKRDRPTKLHKEVVNCILAEDRRWERCDIKSLNLLGSVLAKQKAKESNCHEAILHKQNIVTEGASTNVFIVKNNTVFTHPANNRILNGITRKTIIDLCKQLKIKIIEEEFNVEQLLDADEVFISSTYSDIIPVKTLGEKSIKTNHKTQKEITPHLQKSLKNLVYKQKSY